MTVHFFANVTAPPSSRQHHPKCTAKTGKNVKSVKGKLRIMISSLMVPCCNIAIEM